VAAHAEQAELEYLEQPAGTCSDDQDFGNDQSRTFWLVTGARNDTAAGI
jgi:hypothetical protein